MAVKFVCIEFFKMEKYLRLRFSELICEHYFIYRVISGPFFRKLYNLIYKKKQFLFKVDPYQLDLS